MGHSRPRYNAKGRATSRRAKDRTKQQATVAEPDEGPEWARGMDVIVPDAEEKQRRRTELLANSGKYDESEKMSTKKKKRLDQYIEKKLKQERRGKLLKSLERSQATVQDPLAFISTSAVHASSSATPLTQREELERRDGVESKKRERARDLVEQRRRGRGGYHTDSEEEESDEADQGQPVSSASLVNPLFSGAVAVEGPSPNIPSVKAAAPAAKGVHANGAGTGLAAGAKMVVVQGRRKRRKVSPIESEKALSSDDSVSLGGSSEEEEWNGIADGAEDDDRSPVDEPAPQPRVKGSFRDWANARLREADPVEEEPEPTTAPLPPPSALPPTGPREPLPKIGPLGTPLAVPDTALFHQKTVHVPISRTAEIESVRAALPVVAEEDAIMDLIRRHEVVVICGETGSGKTTQVPQFLYEAGFGSDVGDNPGMIGVTQPRRVAAVSMASRVEEEMNVKGQGVVGHQIRYDATVGPKTKLKFMTDGVLLRELAADLLLAKYSIVIIDEAHERSVNTDVLIGVLSRVVKLRSKKWIAGEAGVRPLRLVIMSATLRVTDFVENKTLFSTPPPLINVTARQHPVVVHFNRKTEADYVEEAYKKVSKIHARLPPGGILVFLTGQNEITTLCRKLEKRFGRRAVDGRKRTQQRLLRPSSGAGAAEQVPEEQEPQATRRTGTRVSGGDAEAEDVELEQDTDLAGDVDDGEQEEDPEALDTDDEDDLIIEGVVTGEDSLVPMHILPLYSLLPNDQQMRVFKPPPSDSRLVIVSTNVAETSLTIPNIKYVVDAGRAKERRYDLATGVQDFGISWISKASAAQRTGRAGRTGPGHCYRLYSSAVYEHHFDDFAKPEIARTPIEGVVLQMKAMNIDAVVNFPFPTPPDRASLQKAEATLTNLGALEKGTEGLGAQITELGRAMASYPLAPRFARMLVSGNQHGCLPYVVALVSIFSVGDPFLRDDGLLDDDEQDAAAEDAPELDLIKREEVRQKEARKLVRKKYFDVQSRYGSLGGGTSDAFKALAVVGAYEFEGGGAAFCEANFVRPKAMEEIHKLRAQIGRIVEATTGADAGFTPKVDPPSDAQCRVLRQLLLAAFPDQVAVRKDLVDKGFGAGAAKRSQGRLVPYRVAGLLDDIFIHPCSVHYLGQAPEFVVYHELHRAKRIWIKGLTSVNAAWLPVLAKSLCTFSRPLDAKDLDHKLSGQLQKPTETERECFVVPKYGGPSLDVPLAPVKATQKRVNGRWAWQ